MQRINLVFEGVEPGELIQIASKLLPPGVKLQIVGTDLKLKPQEGAPPGGENVPTAGIPPVVTRAAVGAPDPEPPAEVDAAGEKWNPDKHASTKKKNNDGTWKKRKGGAKKKPAPPPPPPADDPPATNASHVTPSEDPNEPPTWNAAPSANEVFDRVAEGGLGINWLVEECKRHNKTVEHLKSDAELRRKVAKAISDALA